MRESLIGTCPDLYKSISPNVPHDNNVYQSDLYEVSKKLEPEEVSNETWVNSVLMEFARYPEILPKNRSITDYVISMDKIEAESLELPYSPSPDGDFLERDYTQLAATLYSLTEKLTLVVSDRIYFIHGDFGLNNVLFSSETPKVIDYESSYFSDNSEDRYKNICQLMTRLWFNRPLLRALATIQKETLTDDQKDRFVVTLHEAVSSKFKRGVYHYSAHSSSQDDKLSHDMDKSLRWLESFFSE